MDYQRLLEILRALPGQRWHLRPCAVAVGAMAGSADLRDECSRGDGLVRHRVLRTHRRREAQQREGRDGQKDGTMGGLHAVSHPRRLFSNA